MGNVPPPMPNMPMPQLMVQIGEGNSGPITPAFHKFSAAKTPGCGPDREAAATFPSNFTTIYVPPPTNRQYFLRHRHNGVLVREHYGQLGEQCAGDGGDAFQRRACTMTCRKRSVTFANGGTALNCAQFIKDLLVCAFGPARRGVVAGGL
jgi:hypothetical protein